MSADVEFISQKNFNQKFKNMLRDMYVYQFKDERIDFHDTASFTRSRAVAAIIACAANSSITPADFSGVQMRHIKASSDEVTITLCDEGKKKSSRRVTFGKPLSEMFKYLTTDEPTAYFLTGNITTAGKKMSSLLDSESAAFRSSCSPNRTPEKMYNYWARVYLEEANKSITSGTYRNDSIRLKNLIVQMSGVQWTKAPASTPNTKSSKKADSNISCATFDTRELTENPFHLLYRYCNRYNNSDKDFFNLLYAAIFYFNIGGRIKQSEPDPNCDFIKDEASRLFNNDTEKAEEAQKSWDQMTPGQKARYASLAISGFMKNGLRIIMHLACTINNINIKSIPPSDITQAIKRLKDNNYMISGLDRSLAETSKHMRLFLHLVTNRREITFDGRNFKIIEAKRIEADILFIALADYIQCGKKQFTNIIREFVDIGILEEQNEGRNSYFSMPTHNLKDILGNNKELSERFSEMISFFSQTAMLGEIGSYISDRLPKPTWRMFYKHNYIVRALNDDNIFKLLLALQPTAAGRHHWVKLECRNALNKRGYQCFVCYPIKILDNVSDGKAYLLFYHSQYRSIATIRIDLIDKITIGSTNGGAYFTDDMENAQELMRYTWGINFPDFYAGNVKTKPHPCKVRFTIRFNTETEKFIETRISREIKNDIGSYTVEKLDDQYSIIKVITDIVNPWDMLQWIRSYTRRIYDVRINYSSFMDDVERAHEMYSLSMPEQTNTSLSSISDNTLLTTDTDFKPVTTGSDCLFHEFYCESFRAMGRDLCNLISLPYIDNPTLTKIEKFAVQVKNSSRYYAKFRFNENIELSGIYDLIPLTKLEIQWIRNVLGHDLARAFLSKKEIDTILSALPEMNWFNVFNTDTVKLIDQHAEASLDSYYRNTEEQAIDIRTENRFEHSDIGVVIRKMAQAISERRVVTLTLRTRNNKPYTLVPYCIEYSRRDNRFRIKAIIRNLTDRQWEMVHTFNADHIFGFELTDETVDTQIIEEIVNTYNSKDNRRSGKRELTIYFSETDADRILTEFSCYQKYCERCGNERYKMTLTYYDEDHMEIVIRLLSYGSLISVWGDDDDKVVNQLKLRYDEQVNLFNERSRDRLSPQQERTQEEIREI